MKRVRSACLLAALLIVIPQLAFAQYGTPGSLAVKFEPQAFELGDYTTFDEVVDNYDYDYLSYVDTMFDDDPDATINDLFDVFYYGNGPWVWLMAHTNVNWFYVQVYQTAGVRDYDATVITNAYAPGDIATATHLDEFGTPKYYVIGVTATFVQSHLRGQNAFITQAGCTGAQNALQFAYQTAGVRAYVGYTSPMSNSDIFTSSTKMFARMMRPAARTVNQAVNGSGTVSQIDSRMYAYDPQGTVLAPIVSSTSYDRQVTLNGARSDTIYFDCPMEQQDAAGIVHGSDGLEVSNARWLNSSQLVFTGKPKYRGTVSLTIAASSTRSINGITLDGNQDPFPGPDGFAPSCDNRICSVTSTVGGDNPLAVVSAFRVEDSGAGIHGRMMTEVEAGSDSFYVQRSSSPTGPFTLVATWSSNGPSEYVFDDPSGRVGDWYEAWEVDTAGVRIRVVSEQATLPIHNVPDSHITAAAGDSLIVSMLQLYPDPMFNRPASSEPVLHWAAIVPNENYRSAIQPLANKHNTEGLASDVLTMEEIVNSYGTIQNFSQFWRSYGLRFILRCGDANNWPYHNNPLYYNGATGWSYAPYGSQQLLDIMPLAYQLDPNGRMPGSTTYVTPEMPNLLDGDVDGDSLSDVAVGIMPAGSPAELALMVRKQLKYQEQTAPGSPHLTMYVDARMLNGNDGSNARQLADSIAAAAQPHINVVELINDDTLNLPYATRQVQAVNDLSTLPTMIMPFGVTTTRYNWAFLNKLGGFDWSQTPTVPVYPFLDGWSCDLADFDRSEDTYSLPFSSRPIFHDAMMDTLHGPACGIGALRGTFIRGDLYSALAFHDIVLRHGAPSAGEAFVGAMHRVAALYPEYMFQYRSFVYFGDPAAVIPGMIINATTAVGDGQNKPGMTLSRPWPNPVRGKTSIRYTLPTSTMITLSVVDVQGRVIRQLASEIQSVGVHTVNITTDLNPGMYFLRLRAGAVQQTQKMVVIR